MTRLFSFPNPVNEVSARLVAGGVVVMAVATLVFDQPWIMIVLAYGFVARVLTGPKLSPLGQLVTRVITPRLRFEAKWVAGPPKRFAQGMGAAFTVSAVILHYGFGLTDAAYALIGVLIVAATLESVFAMCVGCKVFAVLMRAGSSPKRCASAATTSGPARRAEALVLRPSALACAQSVSRTTRRFGASRQGDVCLRVMVASG